MESTQYFDVSQANLTNGLLHRFYEPLSLLAALGKARNTPSHKSLRSLEQIDSLPFRELRREFLGELAFLCDHKKGGDTVTAIGLEQTPQGWQFWVAANECPQEKIVPFLKELLNLLEAHEKRSRQLLTKAIFNISVAFAHDKLKTYARFLVLDLEKLKDLSSCQDSATAAAITIWMSKLESLTENEPHSLVQFAYKNRHSDFVRQLASLAQERRYKSSEDSLQAICMSARHQIGRLGLHARASRALAMYASRMMSFLDFYKVLAVPIPKGIKRPSRRNATTVQAAVGRMMSDNGSNIESYRKALTEMDGPLRISERFLYYFCSGKSTPRVHAEVQVLHHFEELGLDFAEGDKFIACSKPACFCCHLFFRHHPGGFVEPRSHHKVYTNWLPPGVQAATHPGKENQLRDILNLMIRDIRQDALRQVIEKAGPRYVHPDSVTGISASVLAPRDLDALSVAAENNQVFGETVNDISDYSSFDSDNTTAPYINESSPSVDSDTDEGGGVSLVGD